MRSIIINKPDVADDVVATGADDVVLADAVVVFEPAYE